ncbi:MAG: hypothetical protein QNK23_16060 [Crocinitomicaceae bacterium]|nr:hypothetical protein [Crocinitomicaceae bacterium]
MRHLILISLLSILTIGCTKKFPKVDELQGTWIEQTDNEIVHTLVFDENILTKTTSTGFIDVYEYELNKKENTIILKLISSGTEGSLEITLNKRDGILGLFGFYAYTFEGYWSYFEKQ